MMAWQHAGPQMAPTFAPTANAFDYEIRLHRIDGTLSVVMWISAAGDGDARRQAQEMLREGLSNAHIWRDGKLMDSLYAQS